MQRREFVKKIIAGSAIVLMIKPAKSDDVFIYIVDAAKCIGCGSCVRACRKENKVMEGKYRTWVERYVVTTDGSIESVQVESPHGGEYGFEDIEVNEEVLRTYFVPKLCMHCEKAPCVKVCPVKATWLTPEGVVLIDKSHCIGCKYCIQACPYGARYFNHHERVVDKCTWCYHRIMRELKPACVTVCPTGARIFGKLSDDHIQAALRDRNIQVLKPELNTRPKVFYKNVGWEVW
ncbi:4Fe-4S dicluster domain-containing protein [Geoglobus acetivorans]|uniref:4Fe-4S ferredoxin iron-sulfur binding domain protein n=1 Tax=Geoglobus acetivorans TaxID=565033 RepID=A0A0A7GEC8_GEOAI|nr:4Fe-4S ferredoxin iron-sulfur binding domain protein [Geoglobus acetivorans]